MTRSPLQAIALARPACLSRLLIRKLFFQLERPGVGVLLKNGAELLGDFSLIAFKLFLAERFAFFERILREVVESAAAIELVRLGACKLDLVGFAAV